MNAADIRIETERAKHRLAAEARLSGAYQAVCMTILQAAKDGDYETAIKFTQEPHPGIEHALEEDGYELRWEDDEDDQNVPVLVISWEG